MVVHGHEDEVPADAAGALAAVAGDAMADLVEAPQLLDVNVQQLAGVVALVALYGLVGAQVTQPRQPGATQHAAYRRPGHAHVRGDACLQVKLAAQLHDGQGHMRLDGAG
ncbi:hypothetical protein D9M72_489930 [compost metagenome]